MLLKVAVVIAGIVLLLVTTQADERWQQVAIGACAVVLLVGGIQALVQEYRQDAKRKTTGTLPAFSVVIDSEVTRVARVEIGRSGQCIQFKCPEDAEKVDLSAIARLLGPGNVWLNHRNGKVTFSGTIRNKEGHLIADIHENKWTLNPGHYFDRNYDDRCLEIVDNKGWVVLQIECLEDRITLQGIFLNRSGAGAAFVAEDNKPGAGIYVIGEDTKDDYKGFYQPMREAKRLFVYPSENHLGERVDPPPAKHSDLGYTI
ncbi:MAG: hypothetical protein WD063_18265 [Pirellulales bacterium]